jgi:transcriptional regulator with XRE-family HTH domain
MKNSNLAKKNEALIGWLKTCREEKKITTKNLAKQMNAHLSWIEEIESGDYRLDMGEYLQICKILEIDPHEGIKIITKDCL